MKIEHSEYIFKVEDLNNGNVTAHIKRMGNGGWELCGVVQITLDKSGLAFIYYFKRKVI